MSVSSDDGLRCDILAAMILVRTFEDTLEASAKA